VEAEVADTEAAEAAGPLAVAEAVEAAAAEEEVF
jgi:hypothetical protein